MMERKIFRPDVYALTIPESHLGKIYGVFRSSPVMNHRVISIVYRLSRCAWYTFSWRLKPSYSYAIWENRIPINMLPYLCGRETLLSCVEGRTVSSKNILKQYAMFFRFTQHDSACFEASTCHPVQKRQIILVKAKFHHFSALLGMLHPGSTWDSNHSIPIKMN
jgi:hypothetical protein